MVVLRWFAIIHLALLLAGPASAQRNLAVDRTAAPANDKRVALVIGNSTYRGSPLKNPVNDARDMANSLRGFGFEVIERTNLTTRQVGQTLREFRSKLTPGSVAVVFYAGHGVQIKGENYLPTVDAEINGEEDIPLQSLSTRQIMDVLADSRSRMNLVFLDACRDNPYSRSFRSASRGIAKENAPSGTLISFATRPGSVAADGDGRNGLYTSVLLQQIKQSNQPIEQVLKRVVSGVRVASKGQQEPWMEGSIEGDFCFGSCGLGNGNTAPSSSQGDADEKYWEDSKAVGSKAGYEAYLLAYPNGKFSNIAKAHIERLSMPIAASQSNKSSNTTISKPLTNPSTEAEQQYLLGLQYENGTAGKTKDISEAIRLYRLAVDQGNEAAQVKLAIFYESGREGLTKDDAESVRLYRLAANQGNAIAQYGLGRMYSLGLGGLTKDDAEAVRLYRSAANQDNAFGQNNLGLMYANGRGGLAKDDAEAVRLYRLAANQGNALAQANLGFMYLNGYGLRRDYSEALRLFRLSVDSGHSVGQANLGLMYLEGRGVQIDRDEAIRLYQLAARQNNVIAQNKLKELGVSW